MTLATDTFTRTVSGGWGTADTGGAWTVTNGTYFTVNGSKGLIAAGAGSTAMARLGSVSATNTDVLVAVTVPTLPNSGSLYTYVHSRSISDTSSGSTAYGAIVQVTTAGVVSAIIRVNGAGVLSSGTLFTAAAGDTVWVRVRTTGASPTTISAKAWKSTSSEPSAWSVTTTDTTSGLQTSGAVAVGTYVSSAATNTPLSVGWDSVTVTDVTAAPQVSAGANTTVTVGTTTTLNGTATVSGGATISSESWSCTSYPAGGSAPTLTGGSTLTPSFIPATVGAYVFQLTVTDSNGNSASASTTVTANPVTAAPTAAATVTPGRVRVDATGSTAAVNGDTLSYTISPSTGVVQPASGIFDVPAPSSATSYTVTVTEVETGNTSTVTVSVPAIVTAASVSSKTRVGGAWT